MDKEPRLAVYEDAMADIREELLTQRGEMARLIKKRKDLFEKLLKLKREHEILQKN